MSRCEGWVAASGDPLNTATDCKRGEQSGDAIGAPSIAAARDANKRHETCTAAAAFASDAIAGDISQMNPNYRGGSSHGVLEMCLGYTIQYVQKENAVIFIILVVYQKHLT